MMKMAFHHLKTLSKNQTNIYFHTTLNYNSCMKVGENMNYKKQLDFMLEQKKGILLESEALAAGISKYHFFEYVKNEELERVAPGIYLLEDAWEDGMYILQSRYRQAVFSHETALYLLGMAEREPLRYTVTVKGKYNSPALKAQGVKIYRIKPELHELGIIHAESPGGHTVRLYNAERTICDIIRSRRNVEIQDFQVALKEYVRRKDKNIPRLMEYSAQFRVETILRKYLEVLL